MRTSWIIAFCFSVASLSFGQPQLAPNPGCSNGAPYCRTQVALTPDGTGVAVIGFHNGSLYAWQEAGGNGTCNPALAPGGFNFYATSTFSPERWSLQNTQGFVPAASNCASVAELVFAPAACRGVSYKYVYLTSSAQILRATSASNDWNFTDVGSSNLPSLPPDTGARIGSFAIGTNTSGGVRLFYGNYNNHSYNGMNPPYGGYVWSSDDCGNTWTIAQFFGGREVHSIEIDPANLLNVYVNIDDECSPDGSVCPNPAAAGLWKSTDGGNTFSHISSTFSNGTEVVGIDTAFSNLSNNIFMETDGNGSVPSGGPLLSVNKIYGGYTQFVPWPTVTSGAPAWAGSASGIKSTSEQNIFLATNSDFSPPRAGLWYFVPPDYDTPILLEDLAPPISYVGTSSGIATVITYEPHNLHTGDLIWIDGVSTAGLNTSSSGVPITVTGPYIFTYSCPNCPLYGTGGFARKPFLYWGYHTVEVTDPATNITYLYNQSQKIPKPRTTAELTTILAAIYELVTH